jgi:hypothetical protein
LYKDLNHLNQHQHKKLKLIDLLSMIAKNDHVQSKPNKKCINQCAYINPFTTKVTNNQQVNHYITTLYQNKVMKSNQIPTSLNHIKKTKENDIYQIINIIILIKIILDIIIF